VGLFGFEKLIPPVPACALAVVKLIEGVSKDLRRAGAVGIKFPDGSANGLQFDVSALAAGHALLLPGAVSAPLRLLDELGKPDLERFRDSSGDIQRGLADSALDHANVGRVEPRSFSQLLLREASSHTPVANGCSEGL
jgi:hypothetical protein